MIAITFELNVGHVEVSKSSFVQVVEISNGSKPTIRVSIIEQTEDNKLFKSREMVL